MDTLDIARWQFAITTVYHFLFVPITIGLSAIVASYEVAWLRTGQTLSAVWLQATRAGLSIVPLSQAIEVPETREALHRDVFAGMARPQLLLRVGWQEIARATLARTPRRPLDDVLLR